MGNLPKSLPGALSLLRNLRATACLLAGIAPVPANGIPSFPQYSGILYTIGTQELNPGVTTHAETVAATKAMIGGMSLVFPDQAAFEMTLHHDNGPGSVPSDPLALEKIVREAAPACELGMYVNGMQVPLTQPPPGQFVYKPIERALHDWITAHGAWLRRKSNGAIFEGKPGWGVFDVRAPGFAAFFGSLVRRYRAEYGIRLVFIDETHDTVTHLRGQSDIANKPTDSEQRAGMRAMLLEASGGDPSSVIWNGLMTRAMAPQAFGGRMIQAAAAASATSVIAAMREAVDAGPVPFRISILEQQNDTMDQCRYLACLATLYDGQSGCGANDFTAPLRMPYPAGSWGRPLEYVNGTSTTPVITRNGDLETRELEFATVGVNRATKTAVVLPR